MNSSTVEIALLFVLLDQELNYEHFIMAKFDHWKKTF